MIHADYAKIKLIVEDSQAKYMNKGLIRDTNPKEKFGLSYGLKYTHFKKKEEIAPLEEVEEEEKGAGTLKYQTK
jgi:hypothetical protein